MNRPQHTAEARERVRTFLAAFARRPDPVDPRDMIVLVRPAAGLPLILWASDLEQLAAGESPAPDVITDKRRLAGLRYLFAHDPGMVLDLVAPHTLTVSGEIPEPSDGSWFVETRGAAIGYRVEHPAACDGLKYGERCWFDRLLSMDAAGEPCEPGVYTAQPAGPGTPVSYTRKEA
jgi:hypothetical protein